MCCPQKLAGTSATETQHVPSADEVNALMERVTSVEGDHLEVLDTVEELSQRMDALEEDAGSTKAEDSDDEEDTEAGHGDDAGNAQVVELQVRLGGSCSAPCNLALGVPSSIELLTVMHLRLDYRIKSLSCKPKLGSEHDCQPC